MKYNVWCIKNEREFDLEDLHLNIKQCILILMKNYKVSHGKLGFFNQFWQMEYASYILFEGGFEIPRPGDFAITNSFYEMHTLHHLWYKFSNICYLGLFQLLWILVVIFKQ